MTRTTAARTRAVLRCLAPDGPAAGRLDLGPAWTSLLGGPCVVRPAMPALTGHRALLAAHREGTVAAVWTLPDGAALVTLLDRPLASGLIARVLGEACDPNGPLDVLGEGALTAWAARVAMAATFPSAPPRFRAVTDDPEEALEALGLPPRHDPDDVLAWPWTVVSGDLSGRVTLCLGVAALAARGVATVPWLDAPAVVARLGETKLRVRLLGARAALAARAVAGLRVGDVLLTDALGATHDGVEGPVSLSLGDACAVPAALDGDGRVTITGVGGPPTRLDVHTENDRPALDAAVLGDLPVEVTVELGQCSFSLRTVAQWRVGEVVTFPQRIDTGVTVRAGGRPVARGELVDVDGCVGVALTEVLP
jgi:flagellar motor switch/type III secretory pathway protein FliN